MVPGSGSPVATLGCPVLPGDGIEGEGVEGLLDGLDGLLEGLLEGLLDGLLGDCEGDGIEGDGIDGRWVWLGCDGMVVLQPATTSSSPMAVSLARLVAVETVIDTTFGYCFPGRASLCRYLPEVYLNGVHLPRTVFDR